MFRHFVGECMDFKSLLDETRGVTFSDEEIATMANAYELVKKKLHDRGQPECVNEIIGKRIIDLGKTKTLDSHEIAERVLASFGLPCEVS
jgi:hypothetical protein